MVDVANLQALQSRISVLSPPSSDLRPGRMVIFSLQGTENLAVQGLLDAPFSLTWITKAVQWTTDQPIPVPMNLPPEILDGAPPRVPTVSVVGVPLGTEQLPGTGAVGTTPRDSPLGTFSQIAGTYAVPAQVPVKVEVCWTVQRDGAIASDCSLGTASDSRDLAVAFIPPVAELTADSLVPVQEYEVVANIILTAETTAHAFSLSVPVFVPHVPVPAVAALFRHLDFAAEDDGVEGFAAVVVPYNSPFDEGQVQPLLTALDTLRDTLAELTNVATDSYATSFLLLNIFRSVLSAQPHLRIRRGGVLLRTIFTWLDEGAEGRISSMILLAPPGKMFQGFNRRSYQTGRGWLEISPGRRIGGAGAQWGPELITAVRNIESTAPASAPTGQEIDVQEVDLRFDNMDSARFSGAMLPANVVDALGNRPATACDLSDQAVKMIGEIREAPPRTWKLPRQHDEENAERKQKVVRALAEFAHWLSQPAGEGRGVENVNAERSRENLKHKLSDRQEDAKNEGQRMKSRKRRQARPDEDKE